MSWARRLAEGDLVGERVVVVVAHADDETLWTGSALPRLRDCLLIHLTDGAPRDMTDARRLGISTRDAYADLRARELDRALAALDTRPERIGLGIPDQEVVDRLPSIVDQLAEACRDASVIVTHPYDGGHPDHDAAALATRLAADRIGAAVVEFACYPEIDGARAFGRFWPDPARPEQVRILSPFERGAVARALAEHRSQRDVIDGYLPDAERWRDAPDYDFGAPPPPGRALYDRFGWSITSAGWRERARAVLDAMA